MCRCCGGHKHPPSSTPSKKLGINFLSWRLGSNQTASMSVDPPTRWCLGLRSFGKLNSACENINKLRICEGRSHNETLLLSTHHRRLKISWSFALCGVFPSVELCQSILQLTIPPLSHVLLHKFNVKYSRDLTFGDLLLRDKSHYRWHPSIITSYLQRAHTVSHCSGWKEEIISASSY